MSNIKKPETYKPCRECRFWVIAQDTTACPNCGISMPQWKIPSVDFHFSKYSIVTGGSIYFLGRMLLMLWSHPQAGVLSNLLGILLESVFAGVIFSGVFSSVKFMLHSIKRQRLSQPLQRRSRACLQEYERTIEQRLAEIGAREKQIQSSLQEILQAPALKQSQKILGTLKSGLSALHQQRERYTAKLWEIQLIRWHNALKPLTTDVSRLTYEACEARINALANVSTDGAEMLHDWENVPRMLRDWNNVPDLNQEKLDCITRLRKALETCEQVRQDLLTYKAALAVKGVSPLAEQPQTDQAVTKALEELDVFNVLPDVGEFTSGFNVLETEYFRLQGEEEVQREFEK